ncbi:MAG: hypothetical protein ACRDXB_21990, partial [Actinomycetes bacterium]
MAYLLDEVEHVVSGVQPELPREQDNIVIVLPETVREGTVSALATSQRRPGISNVFVGNLSGPSRNPDRVVEPAVGQIERGSDPGGRRVDLGLGNEHRVDVPGCPTLVVSQRDSRSADYIKISDQPAFGQFGTQG